MRLFDTLSLASRFLPQLSASTSVRRLPGIEPARRDFVQVALGGIPILADQQDLRIVTRRVAEKRHDGARSRVADHLQLANRAVRKAHRVNVEVDDPARVHPTRRDYAHCRSSATLHGLVTRSGVACLGADWRGPR